jgi:hypothetical protein
MNAEQEYKLLKKNLVGVQKQLANNMALQQVKQELLFKKLKVKSMPDAELAIKKLGKAAKKAEGSIKGLMERLKELNGV